MQHEDPVISSASAASATSARPRVALSLLALLVLAALIAAASWFGYRYTYDAALARQAERGQVQLRLYSQALDSELARYDLSLIHI